MPSSRRSSRPRDQIHICLHLLHCRQNSLSTESPQFSSVAQLCGTLCDPTDCSTSSFPIHHQLQKLTQTHVHRVSDAIQNISSSIVPFSSHLQSFPASGSFPMSQFFASGGQSIGSFSFGTSPSNEHLGLISFRTYWFDLLAVQGTLKSLLQHHSSKASILSHPVCPTSQFNSNTNYLETAQSHRLLTPTRLPPTSEAS